MKESSASLELLSIRIDELEKRVRALEQPRVGAVSTSATPFSSSALTGEVSSLQTGDLFPTLGRAMLGVAGAYLLRAVAAAGAVPQATVASVAVIYAFGWLVWAARSSKASGFAQAVYAGTSALILVPLLWEITLHFQAFWPTATAGVLAAFAVLATVLERGGERSIVAWIAQGSAAISAAALAVATHDVLPFVYLLLITVLLNECAKTTGYRKGPASLVSLTADTAIWGMIFIYSGPQNARSQYPDLAPAALILPACLLFAANGTGVAIRVVLRDRRISIFDAIQTMIAFLLAVSSVLYFARSRGTAILGLGCLMLSAALYATSFRQFRKLADSRNFRIFGMWSAALLLAGALWALPHASAVVVLACSAAVAYLLAARMNSLMLDLHGAIFLTAALGISASPEYVFDALAGSLPGRRAASFVIVVSCAAAAFVVTDSSETDSWPKQVLEFIPAFAATCGLAALLARGALAAAALISSLDVHHVAFLRTLTVCLISLTLAYTGSRLGRFMLTRMAYIALAFVAAKLLFEDLRHGRMEFIAGSIFLFAITLIAVPRLVQRGARRRGSRQAEAELQNASLKV